jgi:hypothetical protein
MQVSGKGKKIKIFSTNINHAYKSHIYNISDDIWAVIESNLNNLNSVRETLEMP